MRHPVTPSHPAACRQAASRHPHTSETHPGTRSPEHRPACVTAPGPARGRTLTHGLAVVIVVLSILFLGCMVAGADVIVADPSGSDAYSILSVMDAGGIRVGNLVFSDFRVVSTASEGGSAGGAGHITVSGVLTEGEYGLAFNGSWTALDGGVADTTIGFKVAADEPWLLHDNSLWISGYGATNGGLVMVTENVYDADPRQEPSEADAVANKLVWYSGPDDHQTYHHAEYEIGGSPVSLSEVWVVKDIHVVSAGAGSTAGVSELYQSFSQVPEPATVGLLALGSIGVILRRRRRGA